MGRNGAGKSTLLRHAAGLMRPTRGKVRNAGRVALLLQNPTDYLVHEHVHQEASAGALATVGLGDPALRERHPRDLSGGEKQRLALAIVLDGTDGTGGNGTGGNGAGGGIGLENVRRRLELTYNGRHQLEIRKEDKHYSVLLKIPVQ
jgi:ABC-type sulfate/molybdate transport systems ATPase subunit